MSLAARATVLVAVTVAALLASAPAARADDTSTATRAAALQGLDRYYDGESNAAYILGGTGAVAAIAGGVLVGRYGASSPFAESLGVTWLAIGGLETIGAIVYAFQVRAEIARYSADVARDPAAYRAEELAHLDATEDRFGYFRGVELGLTLAGAAALGFGLATNRDVWKGSGLGVASLALPFFIVDTFNDRRAARYLSELQGLSIQPTPGDRGALVSFDGNF